jgi:hypothetical protein
MRHPVGPLPSSIYWRRRAVVLCLLLLVIALIAWAVVSLNSGDSGNKKAGAGGSDGRTPAESINPTPGPTDSGAITERPGGRPSDSASPGGGGAGDGGGTGGSGGSSDGAGGDDGANGDDGADGSGGAGTGGAGNQQAAASLPDCAANNVVLALRSAKNTYGATERPTFVLTLTNNGSAACKADLSAVSAVLTVTDGEDRHVWASDDCPSGRASHLVRVPAKGKATREYTWDRERSAPQCATVSAAAVEDGQYVAEVTVPGLGSVPASFVLRS